MFYVKHLTHAHFVRGRTDTYKYVTVAGILYLMAETFKIEILALLDRYFYAD